MSESALPAHRADARVVAITGACHFLGTELIKRLEEDATCARILALDIRKPDIPLEKTEFHHVDLTVPGVDRALARLLQSNRVDTLIHAAFLSFPTHASEWAHELEDVGTMHVLNACAEVSPARFILASTTLVYGASSANPNFFSESDPLKGHPRSRFISDKVGAERQVWRFADEHPEIQVAVLRFAPILGPTINNMFTRFFSRPMAPVIMGYDPLLQFVHENDAVTAFHLAVNRSVTGAFNIVGKGVLPYRTVLALMGRLPLPLPHLLARPLAKTLWVTQVADTPPSFIDFLRFLCVADGERAKRKLGFVARFGIKRTVLDFAGVAADDGAPDPIHAQG